MFWTVLPREITILKPVQVLLFFVLLFAGLYFAREFLIPLAFGGVLATLILPVSRFLESRGINKVLSIVACLLVLLLVAGGLVSLLIWQISDLANDFSQMQQQVEKLLDKVESFLSSAVGIRKEKQQEIIKQQQAAGSADMAQMVSGVMGVMVDFVLVLVYSFLFVYFRSHLKKFILRIVPSEDIKTTEKVVRDSARVSYQYLSGLTMMIVMLWILYSIGFSVAGLKSAVFFAILCGLLEVIPFIGNLTGTSIAVLMAVSQNEGSGLIIGVVGTYLVVQFVQTYILEPLVVGSEVNINPLFTIMVLVVGELVWGIAGMILAIPLLGIVKILFDNIESLKPYGFLIGGNSRAGGKKGVIEKVKMLVKKK